MTKLRNLAKLNNSGQQILIELKDFEKIKIVEYLKDQLYINSIEFGTHSEFEKFRFFLRPSHFNTVAIATFAYFLITLFPSILWH